MRKLVKKIGHKKIIALAAICGVSGFVISSCDPQQLESLQSLNDGTAATSVETVDVGVSTDADVVALADFEVSSTEPVLLEAPAIDLSDVASFDTQESVTFPGEENMIMVENASAAPVAVYAPSDIELTSVMMTEAGQTNMIFETADGAQLLYEQITDPVTEVSAGWTGAPTATLTQWQEVGTNVTFKAGEIIGHTVGVGETHKWGYGYFEGSNVTDQDRSLASSSKIKKGRPLCAFNYLPKDMRKNYFKKMRVKAGKKAVCRKIKK